MALPIRTGWNWCATNASNATDHTRENAAGSAAVHAATSHYTPVTQNRDLLNQTSKEVARARRGEAVNLYKTFNAQADQSRAYHSENFGIMLLSPYVIHSASVTEEKVFRIFMKVAFSRKRFFDNRELRRNPAFDNESWYRQDTVGYVDGFFSHAHWNERFLKCDLPRS